MSDQTSYLGVVKAVLLKDLRIELRSKETLATMGLFGLVMTFVLAFGFTADPATNRKVIPGALWTALLFAGVLGVGRTFAREAKDDAFTAMILSPAPRSAILLAKMVVNLLLSLSIVALVTPLFAVILQVDLTGELAGILGLLFLGATGFAVVGTPLAVMAVNARFAEVLLPMVVFPMVTPVLIGGVSGTAVLLGLVFAPDGLAPWVQGMVAFDVAFGVGALFLFEKMVTE
ncbi:MAG: heme exporter protein CcmB [Myxococcales bacterium]|nr:heme exporter protein CcmB [Myxococcales bacterium]MCB9522117.1 heme exporter protein CcmB [Myxococcales bacterium]